MSLPTHPIPAKGFSLTKGRTPRTGEAALYVQYRCGYIDRWSYQAKQLRWDDTGHDWDIVAVKKAG